MTRGLLIVLALLAPSLAAAKTPVELLKGGHVRVRVSTEPPRQVVIGQQTRFFVEILTDTWFTKAPDYPELALDGAIALMPEQLGTNFTERIDGVTFAAQRRSYVIFPQRAGPLEIPSLQIRLGVSQDGRAGTPFTLRTRSLRLNVVLPPEAEGIEGLVTTPRLRVRDQWSRPLEGLKVGDAVKRTVRMNADRALGMLLPDLGFEAPTGIAVYADQPRTVDSVNRGQYSGERVESVTYVLQRPGEFTLPAITLHWWNPAQGSLATETLEARIFQVGGAATTALLLPPAQDPWAQWRARLDRVLAYLQAHRLALLLSIVAAITAMRVGRLALPAILAWRRARNERRRDSEAQHFRVLERSAEGGDTDSTVGDYWRWRDRLANEFPSLSPAVVDRAAQTSGFAEPWAELERGRYAGAVSAPETAALRPNLRAFRAALRSAGRSRTPHLGSSVLNPRTPAG